MSEYEATMAQYGLPTPIYDRRAAGQALIQSLESLDSEAKARFCGFIDSFRKTSRIPKVGSEPEQTTLNALVKLDLEYRCGGVWCTITPGAQMTSVAMHMDQNSQDRSHQLSLPETLRDCLSVAETVYYPDLLYRLNDEQRVCLIGIVDAYNKRKTDESRFLGVESKITTEEDGTLVLRHYLNGETVGDEDCPTGQRRENIFAIFAESGSDRTTMPFAELVIALRAFAVSDIDPPGSSAAQ